MAKSDYRARIFNIVSRKYDDQGNELLNELIIQKALDKYKLKSIELRAFDYVRQINLFEFLYKKLENKFEYVFLDDGDEITPALFAYLNYIKSTVREFFIGYDILGSSRLGYLGAINIDFEKFLNYPQKVLVPLYLKIFQNQY